MSEVEKYRLIGDHPEVLESGLTLESGKTFELDANPKLEEGEQRPQDTETFKRLVEEGVVISVPPVKEEPPTRDDLLKRAKELGVDGADKLRKDQLQEAITKKEGEQS